MCSCGDISWGLNPGQDSGVVSKLGMSLVGNKNTWLELFDRTWSPRPTHGVAAALQSQCSMP